MKSLVIFVAVIELAATSAHAVNSSGRGRYRSSSYGNGDRAVGLVEQVRLAFDSRNELEAVKDTNATQVKVAEVEAQTEQGLTAQGITGVKDVAGDTNSVSWSSKTSATRPVVKNGTPTFVTISLVGRSNNVLLQQARSVPSGASLAYPPGVPLEDVAVVCEAHVPTTQGPALSGAGTFEPDLIIAIPRPWGHECVSVVRANQPAK